MQVEVLHGTGRRGSKRRAAFRLGPYHVGGKLGELMLSSEKREIKFGRQIRTRWNAEEDDDRLR